MEKHLQLSDDRFEREFAEGSLKPALFSHEAHIRLAWIHIKKYGVARAIQSICDQIKDFATLHGAPGKYHVTVTVAAVRAVDHFMRRSQAATFPEFIKSNPRLKDNFTQLLNAHYSMDLFKSEQARSTYLAPDLLPFDPVD